MRCLAGREAPRVRLARERPGRSLPRRQRRPEPAPDHRRCPEGPPPEILPGRQAPRLPFRSGRRPLPDLDDRQGRQRLEGVEQAKDLIIEAHWRPDGRAVATNSGRGSSILQLDETGAVVRIEPIPQPTPETFFYPLAGLPTANDRRLRDPAARRHRAGPGDLFARRGSGGSAGSRDRDALASPARGVPRRPFLLYVDRGLHVTDLSRARIPSRRAACDGGFQSVACVRAGDLLRRAHERQRRHLADDAAGGAGAKGGG